MQRSDSAVAARAAVSTSRRNSVSKISYFRQAKQIYCTVILDFCPASVADVGQKRAALCCQGAARRFILPFKRRQPQQLWRVCPTGWPLKREEDLGRPRPTDHIHTTLLTTVV